MIVCGQIQNCGNLCRALVPTNSDNPKWTLFFLDNIIRRETRDERDNKPSRDETNGTWHSNFLHPFDSFFRADVPSSSSSCPRAVPHDSRKEQKLLVQRKQRAHTTPIPTQFVCFFHTESPLYFFRLLNPGRTKKSLQLPPSSAMERLSKGTKERLWRVRV